MTTAALSLDGNWTKVADASDATVTLQLRDFGRQLEVGATDAGEPQTPGHIFHDRRLVHRPDIGDGHLYARLAAGPAPATLIVTK